MKTPILGQSYVARSINAADNRMVNLFPEATPENGKSIGYLNRAPGLRFLQSVGTGPIRGLWAHQTPGSEAYVVSGNAFYEIDSSYSARYLGAVSGSGPVSIADNGTQIFIAANPTGYIYNMNTAVFGQITDPDFPGAVTVGYLDGYFVFNEPNSQRIWVTELLDGTSIDPLNFASAEGSPDGLVSLSIDHREAWLFGTDSVEVWYDAGTTGFPLARIQGAFNEIGCVAPYSVAKLDNALFWLGTDARGQGIVYRNQGYTGIRISTHAIEYAIQNYSDISDAVAYTYQQEGHAFYVLLFPSANATWVYDAATGAWHERASWEDNGYIRHRSNCQMNFNGTIVVGDFANSNLYAFDLDTYSDNGAEQIWVRSWRALPSDQNNLTRTAQHSLQVDCETGVGLSLYPAYDSEGLLTETGDSIIAEYIQNNLVTQSGDTMTNESGDILVDIADFPGGWAPPEYLTTEAYPEAPGYNPQIMLRWSDDGGHTWSNEHWKSMGKIGNYGYRTIWRRLGMTVKLRDRVYEISGSDPVKIAIMGAELLLSGTNA
jgi:hypothetical protein